MTVDRVFRQNYDGVRKIAFNLGNLSFACKLFGNVDGVLAGLALNKLLFIFKGSARGKHENQK